MRLILLSIFFFGSSIIGFAQTAGEMLIQGNNKLDSYDYTGAIKDFNRAIKLNSQLFEAYRGRALAKYLLGEIAEASTDIEKAMVLNDDNAQNLYVKGLIESSKKKYKEAIDDFEKALNIDKKHMEAMSGKVLALFFSGKEGEAMRLVESQIEENTNIACLYYTRGQLFDLKQKPEKALEDFNKCLELDPKYNTFNLYLSRGGVYRILEEYAKADEDLNKAITLAPNNPAGYNIRGSLLYAQGNFAAAITDFNKVQELTPDNPSTLYNLGMAHHKLGENTKACEKFRKACSMNYTNACKMIILNCQNRKPAQ